MCVCICLWVHYLYLFIYLFAGYIYRMGSAMRQHRHCSLQIARRAHWRQHRGLGQDHPPGGIQCIQPTCFSFGVDAFLERCFKPESSGQGSTKASCSASSLSASSSSMFPMPSSEGGAGSGRALREEPRQEGRKDNMVHQNTLLALGTYNLYTICIYIYISYIYIYIYIIFPQNKMESIAAK